jgi:hypothetical protein
MFRQSFVNARDWSLWTCERGSHGTGNQIRIRDSRQVDQPDTALPLVDLACCDLDCKTGLAASADAGERDQAMVAQEPLDLRELAFAPTKLVSCAGTLCRSSPGRRISIS